MHSHTWLCHIYLQENITDKWKDNMGRRQMTNGEQGRTGMRPVGYAGAPVCVGAVRETIAERAELGDWLHCDINENSLGIDTELSSIINLAAGAFRRFKSRSEEKRKGNTLYHSFLSPLHSMSTLPEVISTVRYALFMEDKSAYFIS